MPISIVRFGCPKGENEGLRVGTVRRPPRGVRKEDYAAKHLYDVWYPTLAPSEALLKENFPITDTSSWRLFKRKFLAEMKHPDAKRALELFAALSHHTELSVGCYCEDETRCHRSILRSLFESLGAAVA